jgi:hypothetical protein
MASREVANTKPSSKVLDMVGRRIVFAEMLTFLRLKLATSAGL